MKTPIPSLARRGAVRVFAAAVLVVLSSIAGTASADPNLPPIVIGKLLLDLRAPNAFVYGNITEPLTTVSNKDRTLVFNNSTLAVIGPAGQAAFLDKNGKEWIGINSNGLFAGRNQIGDPPLVLSLVAASNPSQGATPAYWSQMSLQFNTKHDAIFDITLSKGGVEGTTYRVFTGLSIVSDMPDYAGPKMSCAEGADSSPDSDAVNCSLGPISGDADTVTFTTIDGDWSLGGEDSVSEFDFFQAPTGVIDCGGKTAAVGNGITQPFAQCTRLENGPSTIAGSTGGSCQVVNYSLTTSCTGTDCTVKLLHGLSGTQDASQFRFLCTVNWTGQDISFGSAPDYASSISLSSLYWGVDDSPSTRQLDYCPGSTVTTSPPSCEAGTVAVTGEFTYPTADSIAIASDKFGAFQSGDTVSLAGTPYDGTYTVLSVTSTTTSSSLTFTTSLAAGPTPTGSTSSVTRLAGCPIVEFDFSGIPTELQDMSTTMPGNQRACLLQQLETQCNASGSSKVCLQQTFGVEGDTTIRRFN